MSSNTFYYCGWRVPFEVPAEHRPKAWPLVMRGWRTGWSVVNQTWVGVVWASSPLAAWTTVLAAYGLSADAIQKRWEPVSKGRLESGQVPVLVDRLGAVPLQLHVRAIRAGLKAAIRAKFDWPRTPVWSEDDARVPDRTTLAEAVLEHTEISLGTWMGGTVNDCGDAIEYALQDDDWIVVVAYDGGHIYSITKPRESDGTC